MTLIARLEAAAEGSRELDAEIARFIGSIPPGHTRQSGFLFWKRTDPDTEVGWEPPHYTTNLQDALALIPDGCMTRSANHFTDGWYWQLFRLRDGVFFKGDQKPTAALALVIAAMKARGL